jgi:sulfur-carrier protein
MKLNVKLFANFREVAGKKDVPIEMDGNTAGDAIKALFRVYPGLEKLMLQEGEIRPYVNIMLNGKNIKDIGGLGAAVKEGDDIAIFPPVSGG